MTIQRRDSSRQWITNANLPIWMGFMFGCSNTLLVQWVGGDSWPWAAWIGLVSSVGGYAGGRLGQRFFGKDRYNQKGDNS